VAGNLGFQEVAAWARRAEATARSGAAVDRADARGLVEALERAHGAAEARVAAHAPAQSVGEEAVAAPFTREDRSALATLLEEGDPEAVDAILSHRASLEARLGAEQVAALVSLIEDFEMDEALELLDRLLPAD
jgi:hypothetical protein